MNDVLILLASGMIISTIVTALGIGGGILWTPLFILGFGLAPHEAIATSLIIQVVGLASGSIAYLRAGLVQTQIAIILFFAALPGVIIGSILSVQLSQHTVQMGLGIMSLTLAVLFVNTGSHLSTNKQQDVEKWQIIKILPIPGFFGLMMGVLSVGISEWLVPALRGRLGLSMPQAVATVIPVMLGLAIAASLNNALLTHVINWEYFVYGALGTVFGGQLGPRLAQKIDEDLLKDSFIYLMTLVGIHLIFQSI